MGWSNQIPPNIITQSDGTTVFTGGISVQASDGSTAATIDTSGKIYSKKAQFDDLLVTAPNQQGLYDVGTKLNQLPAGLVATVNWSGNTPTINDGSTFLVALTNQFSVLSTRSYYFRTNAIRGALGNPSNGEFFVFKLVLYTSYPTAANYKTTGTTLDGIIIPVQPNNNFWMPIPELSFTSYPGYFGTTDFTTCYLGLIVYRASGTLTTLQLNNSTGASNADNGPLEISAIDLGIPSFIAPGVLNPMGYQGTPPAPPATQHQQGFTATWTQTYDGNGNQFYGGTTHMYQGDVDAAGGSGHGITLSAANFDFGTLGSDLNGATSVSVYLNFYCMHTWYNSGMTYNIFAHNTRTGSAPGTSGGIAGVNYLYNGNIGAPGWLSIQLSQSVWQGFINGTLTGFGFYANNTDLSYYGYFGGLGDPNPPYIAAYWTK